MSWTNELYNVYEVASALDIPNKPLPIFHSTANAQINLFIDNNGVLQSAAVIPDNRKKVKNGGIDEASLDVNGPVTIIPVTEDSNVRSSGTAPHPFADKMIYVAGDYCHYCDAKDGDEEKYEKYIDGLKEWADSAYSHPAVKAIYAYLSKGTLIKDLIDFGIFELGEDGKLTAKKIEKNEQKDCFVRFTIIGENSQSRTWLDESLYQKFIEYTKAKQTNKGFCYATGNEACITYKHPSKILNSGDKGKLFSANDEIGFTFRGRFNEKEEAVAIGTEFSQKMHNGLKWLIENYAVHKNDMAIITWDSVLSDLPDICSSSLDFIDDSDDEFESEESFTNYKNQLRTAIFGSENTMNCTSEKTMVMILDEATTGRVSISLYSEMAKSSFLKNLEEWHENTAWFYWNGKENKICSPSLMDIVTSSLGTEQNGILKCDGKLKTETLTRLIPCVIERRKIPNDIVQNLANRASRPLAYSRNNWLKILKTACSLIRKNLIEKGEECTMALDETRTDRDYLFGRLLAVAEVAEHYTYDKNNDKDRVTNAERFFEQFSNRPYETWQVIYNKLQPYFKKMDNGTKIYYSNIIDDINSKFNADDFADNTKLKPIFLLAYSCQRKSLYTKKENKSSTEEE